ncbi:hypothetical protein RclHR1_04810011 [Rhizophagus clarus]|nr:hypothetical protein RclHR1_04810011 [Rhizophagus clarus]
MNGTPGVQKDKKKAFDLLLTTSKEGNNDARYYLAICYMEGMGTRKDEKKAFNWYFESAYNGCHALAQSRLGYCY